MTTPDTTEPDMSTCMRDDCSLAIRAPDTILCQGHFDEQVNRLAEAAAPEPTCATCGDAIRNAAAKLGAPPIWVHDPIQVESPVHHPEPMEAPAPAAPSAQEVAARAFMEDLWAVDDWDSTFIEAMFIKHLAAARVPGGAAGEALEAALREIVRHVYEEPMSEEHIVTTAQSALAAARAPGLVGGEARERGKALNGRAITEDDGDCGICGVEDCRHGGPSVGYPDHSFVTPTTVDAVLAAAAPVEPGGE